MVDASAQTEKLTFEAYDRLYDEIGPIELIEGQIDLFGAILQFEDDHNLGLAMGPYIYLEGTSSLDLKCLLPTYLRRSTSELEAT